MGKQNNNISIRFFGGGRWAKIILIEISKILPNYEINWITNLNRKEKKIFLNKFLQPERVTISQRKDLKNLKEPEKVVICSNSVNHQEDLISSLNLQAKILIEKPIFGNLKDFKKISIAKQKNIFLNLEFFNAFFIKSFFKKMSKEKINSIEFTWHDPLIESLGTRKKKYSEIFSSIFHDQLPHIFSILLRLHEKKVNLSLNKIVLNDSNKNNNIILKLKLNNILTSISISRFSKKRKREISINNGLYILDFAKKPKIFKKGKILENFKELKNDSPLKENLKKFFLEEEIENLNILSIYEFYPFLKLCFDCESKFKEVFEKISETEKKNKKFFKIMKVYYAGIIYFQESKNLKKTFHIHYSKNSRGFKGVNLLLSWLENKK